MVAAEPLGRTPREPGTFADHNHLSTAEENIVSENGTSDYLRNAELTDLAAALKDHRSRAVDVVAPASSLRFAGGHLVLDSVEPVIGVDGVTDVNGMYRPTRVGLEGIATRLDIPLRYLRKCQDGALDLMDHNVNTWLAHPDNKDKKFMARLLRGDEPGADATDGIVRAFLSDSYRTIDNFDILMATLHGMRSAGIHDPLIQADLTERRMVVKVTCPQIAVHVPELLKDYRNPFGDGERALGEFWTPERVAHAAGIEGSAYKPGEEPVLFAGFQISNSETGGGAFRITPRLEVRVCRNGLTLVAQSTKEIHLGAKLDEGVVAWSDETRAANIALVMAQTKDTVTKYLSEDYVTAQARSMEQAAGIEVKASDAPKVIASVSKTVGFTQTEQDTILDFFMNGGQMTAGGIMQAVTAAAQTLSGDDAYEMEGNAFKALAAAGSAARKA